MVVAMMMALVLKALMRLGEVGGSHKKGEDDQRRGATQDLHQGPQFISEKEIRAHLTFSSHSKPALNFFFLQKIGKNYKRVIFRNSPQICMTTRLTIFLAYTVFIHTLKRVFVRTLAKKKLSTATFKNSTDAVRSVCTFCQLSCHHFV